MIAEWFGGYGTGGYWAFIIGLLFAGSILNAVHNLIVRYVGIELFIYGSVDLLGYINYTIANSPNLPEYAGTIPLLFAILISLVVFKMFLHDPAKKKANNEKEASK